MAEADKTKCPKCDKVYVKKGALLTHLAAKHNTMPSQLKDNNLPRGIAMFEDVEFEDDDDEEVLAEMASNGEAISNMIENELDYLVSLSQDQSKTNCDDCSNGAKEYKLLSNRLKNAKKEITELKKNTNKKDSDLKSCRGLLAKASSDIVILKHKLDTKIAIENAKTKVNEVVVVEENSFQCQMCNFKATSEKEIRGHEKFIHVYCRHCHKHFSEMTELNSHIENVHKTKVHDCAWCKLSFPSETGLQVHRQKKHANEELKCSMCPAKYRLKWQMVKHIKETHIFECVFQNCDVQTDTEPAMIKHLDEDHELGSTNDTTKTRKNNKTCRYFKQGRCTKGSECLFAHKETQGSKVNKYECKVCNYTANTDESLENHMKNKHSHEISHECNICGYTANTNESLDLHKKSKHSKVNTQESITCKNGKGCYHKTQNRCKFSHSEIPDKEYTKTKSSRKCKRGASCEFKVRGNCYFVHNEDGEEVKNKNSFHKANTISKRGNFWCKYQDQCSKSQCEFKHFEKIFIEKPAPTAKPTLAQWLIKA